MKRVPKSTLYPTCKKNILLLLGIILVAANLRAAITSVGPLVGSIRDTTGLSSFWLGMLSTLPLFAFAIFSPLAPSVAKKMGIEKTILFSLVAITVGIAFRSIPSNRTLFFGTAIIGLGIATCNVLLPSLIKSKFPLQVGPMTGIYTMTMVSFAAVASGISFPLAHQTTMGWRGSLLFWILLSIIGILVWIPHLKSQVNPTDERITKERVTEALRSPLAWKVTLYMGLQSLTFYVSVTWLAQILHDLGMTLASAGYMLSLMQLVSIPVSLFIPILAGKRKSQSGFASLAAFLYLSGFVGILFFGSTFVVLWVVLIGLGNGASISMALLLFSLRASNAEQVATLSGMAQSIGYLLAAVGPPLFGYLYDITNEWTIPLLLLMKTCTAQFIIGIGAGRNVTISTQIQIKNQSYTRHF